MKFSANLSTLFTELPLLSRVGAAASHGFKGVEIWFPYELDARVLRTELESHDVECVMINTQPGNVEKGDWGLAVDAKRRTEFLESVEVAADYAAAIGCPRIHAMSGTLPPDKTREASWDVFARNIDDACTVAARRNLTLMIEPLNEIDRPTFLLTRQSQAIDLIEQLDRENLKIMLDVFHLQRGEGNLIERLRESLPHAAHVQIADVPGRHEPGTGEINFVMVLRTLEQLEWKEWVGCEYFPSENTSASFAWLAALGSQMRSR
ncbi:hydroxypyruvate isomerase family protein [Variovorax sp. 770b2]|uniref:hydroxypyruvate isomerase family protein n=1 Tax=Variovorax sp. 770b2 TaxID=1566271 RepID=UPI0008DF7AEC|nr:TIM barrel protein [Variovorax sp. 770b2]SFQ01892.1 hydroxypyruvate isomerase [Variovorax sp. 770b2]